MATTPAEDATGTLYPGWHAENDPGRPALIEAATGATLTYAEIDALANQVSRLLRRVALEVGDHVLLWFDNDVDYPAMWTGARYAGLYYTLVSTRLTPHEVAYLVGDAGARVVVLGARLDREHGAELRRLVGGDVVFIADDDTDDGLRARLARESSEPLRGRVEGTPMLYSSGTTGLPKAVKRPSAGQPLGKSRATVAICERFGMGEGTRYLSPAPLYHAAPMGYVSGVLGLGGTAVIMDHFEPELFLAAIERYRVTHTQVVPTMFVRLLALPDEVKQRYDLSSLEVVLHAAAPCPVPVKEQVLAWFGPIVWEYYSGTEGVGFTVCGPEDWLAHKGSVGRPIAGQQVHIVDELGEELPSGVDGDVYFSGSAGFEYHNDAEKTRGSYLGNGWATFGDVGHVDDDGFLYLTDRRANMIIVGGVNVYPQEAENLLVSHPLVQDAAVFGIPHADLGEEVKAVVDPAPGVVADAELERTLLEHCRARLASVKCPRSIDFRHDLPREPNGKLLKRKLRDEYRASLLNEGDD